MIAFFPFGTRTAIVSSFSRCLLFASNLALDVFVSKISPPFMAILSYLIHHVNMYNVHKYMYTCLATLRIESHVYMYYNILVRSGEKPP